jgi:nitroreductase
MHEDVLKILARRSVRTFTAAPVSDATVRTLLKAAMAAPSARAKDPWHFIVVRNPSLLARIADLLPNGRSIAKAPVGIVVCGDSNQANRKDISYLLQDCSAAIENLLLAASMMGLGACWLGVHPNRMRIDGLRQLFQVPPMIIPVAAIAIGHPRETLAARTRFAEAKVHKEIW